MTPAERLSRIRTLATTFEDGQLDANEVRRLCGEPEDTPRALDPENHWLITASEDVVILQRLPASLLQPEEAIRLAAWLIVGAELAGFEPSLEVATATVDAVRST